MKRYKWNKQQESFLLESVVPPKKVMSRKLSMELNQKMIRLGLCSEIPAHSQMIRKVKHLRQRSGVKLERYSKHKKYEQYLTSAPTQLIDDRVQDQEIGLWQKIKNFFL